MAETKTKITPEKVRVYYIEQKHSLSQTAVHFNRSQSGMEKFLKRNGIRKPKDEVALIRKETITKNWKKSEKKPPANNLDWKRPEECVLKEQYFSGCSQKELALLYNVSIDTMRRWLEFYGIHKTDEEKEKSRREAIKKRYGGYSPLCDEKVRAKGRATCLKKYGAECFQKTEAGRKAVSDRLTKKAPQKQELQEYYIGEFHSIIDTALHFNVSVKTMLKWLSEAGLHKNKNQADETRKNTNKKRFGVENSVSASLVREHYKENCLKKYGFDHPVDERLVEATKILSSEEEFAKFVLENFDDKPNYSMVANALCCSATMVKNAALKNGYESYFTRFVSSPELEIQKILEGMGVQFVAHDRAILDGFEIDIYIPSKKIGIEFNGDYWHSDAIKEKNYHFNKSKLAESKGVRLIHVYEYEWNTMKPKIIQLLKIALGLPDKRIYARQCEIREITNEEAKALNNAVHLQGHRNAQVTYGLFYHGELAQLMSFSKTHYNRNLKGDNSWEIIRGCPGSNNIVIGGVSKLFSHFIKEHDPDEVFSYCDFNKFDGGSYEAIGMRFVGYTGPDKTYLIDGVAHKRNPSKYKEYKEKAEAVIWGAGSKKYLWKKEEHL